MSITPSTPADAQPGEVRTWVTSQWKFPVHPGQLSAEINTVEEQRGLGLPARHDGCGLPPRQERGAGIPDLARLPQVGPGGRADRPGVPVERQGVILSVRDD